MFNRVIMSLILLFNRYFLYIYYVEECIVVARRSAGIDFQ